MKSYKKILVYMTDGEKKQRILSLCRELKLGLDEISYAQINTALVELAGFSRLPEEMRGKTAAPAFYNMPELLVFCGVPEEEVDVFLKRYRETGIPSVSLKAVTTPYNLLWTPYELVKELEKEREALRNT
ncbi:DUF3783 domain-containing protein [Lachnospiraceae bacterium 46-15]